MEEDAVRELVARLSRPHPSGGAVIERAAVLAEGEGSDDVMAWILAHDGVPEEMVVAAPSGGLHGSRMYGAGVTPPSQPSRYVLPAGALS
jgi:hypothetical protein